jgi:hypothetical protein
MSCDPDHSLQDPGVPRSITEVKRDLDRRGTAMIRDIVIMLAVVAAIVAFAPKVSGGANNPVERPTRPVAACLRQRVETLDVGRHVVTDPVTCRRRARLPQMPSNWRM